MVTLTRFSIAGFVVLGSLTMSMPTLASEANLSRERAREIVQSHLDRLKGARHGQLHDVKAECLGTSFRQCHFFVLRFRLYPVAMATEAPLTTNNLFAVCKGKVVHISDQQQLENFFKKNLAEPADGTAVSAAAKSWLALAQELQKDGFFEFEQPSVKVSDGVSEGSVAVVATRGDKGKLTVKLEFVAGKLAKVTSGGKLMAGIRPRCQAMRLLDDDPIIREIMKRDVLVMGRASKPYLDEVRAEASPELQQAIDDVWQQILAEDR